MNRFAEAVLRAVKGESGIIQPSFVYLPGVSGGEVVQKSVDGLDYFSTNIELGVPILISQFTDAIRLKEWKRHILLEISLHLKRSCLRMQFLNSGGILRRVSNLLLKLQSCKPVSFHTCMETYEFR